MSTHKCEVVRVLLEEHPTADLLSIVKVHGYECAVRTEEWKNGDLGVYIPPDSIVPDTEAFKFLDGHTRIRARKIRGRYSQGVLVHAPEGVQEGDDCMEMMGIEHYEPPMPMISGGDNEKGPEGFYPVYDMEDYNRYADDVFVPGEEVVATEKIHGASAKFVCAPDIKSAQDLLATAIQLGEELPDSDLGGMLEYIGRARGRITSSQAICDLECISEGGGVRFIGNSTIPSEWNHKADFIAEHIQKAIINLKGRIWAGSRKNWKKHDEKVWWWQAVTQNPWIEEWCKANPGLVLYGEVFGPTQKMKYGAKQNQMLFCAFDILDKDRWLDYDESRGDVGTGLVWVPEVYRGELDDAILRAKAEENSSVPGADHHREGLVVKPITERRTPEIGRVQLKLKSNRYLAKN